MSDDALISGIFIFSADMGNRRPHIFTPSPLFKFEVLYLSLYKTESHQGFTPGIIFQVLPSGFWSISLVKIIYSTRNLVDIFWNYRLLINTDEHRY